MKSDGCRIAIVVVLSTLLAEGSTTLHKVDLKKFPLATCLDGSPGAFYFWPSTSDAAKRKFVVHHVGGGWCSNDVPDSQALMVDSCYHRSFTSLGSSNYSFYPPNASAGWTMWGKEQTLDDSAQANPMMHEWNKVALVYCDGGSFSGRKSTASEVHGRNLHFRGSYILDAIIEILLQDYDLADATDVVVAGASAGGLATYLHANRWRSAIPTSAFLVALPDGGFFQDWRSSRPSGTAHTYSHELRSVFLDFNASGGLPATCVEARRAVAGDPADCYFAEHVSPFIKVPLFALQSTVDSWQLQNELGNETGVDIVNDYRLQITSSLQETLLTGPSRGGFFDTCEHHCGLWNQLLVNGTSAAESFEQWYRGQRTAWVEGRTPPRLERWQARQFPCVNCCGQARNMSSNDWWIVV